MDFISKANETEKDLEREEEKDTTLVLEEYDEKIEEFKQKIEEFEKKIDKMDLMIETHKHSGKETADISQILQERLGIKMGTFTSATGTEGMYFDFAGVLKSIGRAQFGETRVYSLMEKYFGIEWTGGGEQFFTTNAEFILPKFASNPTAVSGSIYYNTTENKVKVNEDGTWKTITTS